MELRLTHTLTHTALSSQKKANSKVSVDISSLLLFGTVDHTIVPLATHPSTNVFFWGGGLFFFQIVSSQMHRKKKRKKIYFALSIR